MTLSNEFKEFGNLILYDTQGFDDPKPGSEDLYLWNVLTSQMQGQGMFTENIKEHGISTILMPIMLDSGSRFHSIKLKVIYNTLMLFTLIYPDFEVD